MASEIGKRRAGGGETVADKDVRRIDEQGKLKRSRREVAATEALRPRPRRGKVDYDELSREHIARYPKVRARLAE